MGKELQLSPAIWLVRDKITKEVTASLFEFYSHGRTEPATGEIAGKELILIELDWDPKLWGHLMDKFNSNIPEAKSIYWQILLGIFTGAIVLGDVKAPELSSDDSPGLYFDHVICLDYTFAIP